MLPVEIKKNVYWLGVIDWNVRYFHGATYTTNRGTTYNSYLLLDEAPTLVDTCYTPFAGDRHERRIAKMTAIEKQC